MSPKPSHSSIKTALAVDGHGGVGGQQVRNRPPGAASNLDDQRVFSPPPLPSDPATLDQIRSDIDRGLADARAGIGKDWEVAHARIFDQ